MYKTLSFLSRLSLPQRIVIGLVIGTLLGLLLSNASWIGIFGSLFVGALKAIAPVLVFILVVASLSRSQTGFDRRFGFVIFEYLLSTFLAAVVAVIVSFLYPVSMSLDVKNAASGNAPEGVWEVIEKQLLGMVAIPSRPSRTPIISPSFSGLSSSAF